MILLTTPSARGQECADALRMATGEETHWAQNLHEAAARLRLLVYDAVVIDQFLLETQPEDAERLFEHMGTAFPLHINFAVTGMERLVREVRFALHRRKREECVARQAVAEQMRSEMNETLTAMLLSCDLAMAVPGTPAPTAEKIREIGAMARELTARLRGD